MFTPTRDEARRFMIEAWRKYAAHEPLTALERMTGEVVAMHPEYRHVLDSPEQHAHRDYHPESGEINPFLHLSLHLAVAEQLSIDQPHGLREHYERLKTSRGDEHDALHALVECLGETVWHAQRHGTQADGALYLACVERQR